jgi:hypothetical protein
MLLSFMPTHRQPEISSASRATTTTCRALTPCQALLSRWTVMVLKMRQCQLFA